MYWHEVTDEVPKWHNRRLQSSFSAKLALNMYLEEKKGDLEARLLLVAFWLFSYCGEFI